MPEIQLAHTASIDPGALRAARALLDDVFAPEMTDEDWDHALGGMHAIAWEGSEIVGHASVIQRQLRHGGRWLRAGYVEGVGVRADRRRRGHGSALMEPLEEIVRRAYDIGALGATEMAVPFYAARGWRAWPGPTWAQSPQGPARTEDEDGRIFVLEAGAALDWSGDLTCDWREGEAW